MPVKPILVLGSTGLLGSEICNQLATKKLPSRALIYPGSDLSNVQQLIDLGIEPMFGDVTNPGSLHRAFENVSTVISTVSSCFSDSDTESIDRIDKEGLLNVIDAALEAAVDSFIYISFLHSPYKFPLQDAKQDIEKEIERTSMRYTILRPTFFMDLWLSPFFGFDPLNRKVTIYGSGANKISYITIKDVARFAIASIMNPYAWNRIIDLGGPEAISLLQVVKIFEEEIGEQLELTYLPEELLQQQFDINYNSVDKSTLAMKLGYASGAEVDMKKTMSAFNFKLSTVRDYCQSVIPVEKKHRALEQI